MDAFSRRVVGWSLATRLEKDLVIKAPDMAVAQRKSRDVIHSRILFLCNSLLSIPAIYDHPGIYDDRAIFGDHDRV